MIESITPCATCGVWMESSNFSLRVDHQRHMNDCHQCTAANHEQALAEKTQAQQTLTEKECSICKQVKPVSAFYFNAARGRYRSSCTPCASAGATATKEANKEKYQQKERERGARRRKTPTT